VSIRATDARGVIFDMDGVLIDSGAHHRDAWRLLLGDMGVEPPPDYSPRASASSTRS